MCYIAEIIKTHSVIGIGDLPPPPPPPPPPFPTLLYETLDHSSIIPQTLSPSVSTGFSTLADSEGVSRNFRQCLYRALLASSSFYI